MNGSSRYACDCRPRRGCRRSSKRSRNAVKPIAVAAATSEIGTGTGISGLIDTANVDAVVT